MVTSFSGTGGVCGKDRPGGRETLTCGVRTRASRGCRSRIPFLTPHPASLVWDAGDAAAGRAPLGGTARAVWHCAGHTGSAESSLELFHVT